MSPHLNLKNKRKPIDEYLTPEFDTKKEINNYLINQ